MECQQNYKRLTLMHEAEKLSTSRAIEQRHETKGTRVKIPGVNISESAQSIISVEVLAGPSNQVLVGPSNQVLAERVKKSSLGNEGPSNQVLAERVKQSSPGGESQVIKS